MSSLKELISLPLSGRNGIPIFRTGILVNYLRMLFPKHLQLASVSVIGENPAGITDNDLWPSAAGLTDQASKQNN